MIPATHTPRRARGPVMAGQQKPILQRLFAHVMSFGLCVVLPAAVMSLMPVTSTTFTRDGAGVVRAVAVQRIFFVIPFLSEEVTVVTGVDDDHQSGTMSKTTRSGPVNDPKRPETRAEDMSWLVIQGRTGSIRVPVSPVNMDDVRRRARDFLQEPDKRELRLLTVANWKISVIAGGALCVLTLVYLGSLARGLVSVFRRDGA